MRGRRRDPPDWRERGDVVDFQNLSSKTELEQHRVLTAALPVGPHIASCPLRAPSSLLEELDSMTARPFSAMAFQTQPGLSGHVPPLAPKRWTRHMAEKLQNYVPKISERLADGDVVCRRGRSTNWK